MSSPGSSPVVNRGDAIPVLRVDDSADKSRVSSSIQDRLFGALFSKILPQDVLSSSSSRSSSNAAAPSGAATVSVERPNFSLPQMSTNFRRFNARIGVVFVFQAQAIRLFSWEKPVQTVSFLAVYTLLCLNPGLLLVVPLAICLFGIMVPAFLSRHPPPPDTHPIAFASTPHGPASAPAANIKPAPEMSKDFFRNMRDLQNCMEDFSVIHDQLISLIAPVTNFSDEKLSSAVFLALFITCCLLFIASNLLPWRAVMLTLGWALVGSSHPIVKSMLSPSAKAKLKNEASRSIERIEDWARKDITLDEAPEVRQVEMFELQRQQQGSEWELWLYSNSPYDPQSPLRLSGDRPRGTRFFEDVEPPKGWEWKDKKWTLDLFSRDWVEERMITAVEVEVDEERWVYDIGASDDQDSHLDDLASVTSHATFRRDWEESSGHGPKGQWRRRRWVRLVRRKVFKHQKEVKR